MINAQSSNDTESLTSRDIPKHVAIIMDGNRRWAKIHGYSCSKGHQQGLEAAKIVVKCAAELKVPFISLYTFSTENWKRTQEEVGFLMNLIKNHLKAELQFYAENSIRVKVIGDRAKLPPDIVEEIDLVERETAFFNNTTVVLAINYGGKDEIIRALKKIPTEKIATITEESFDFYLDLPKTPPVDLLIRTGGEQRISNFLLWQSAYAELYFNDKFWPDWNEDCFNSAILWYQSRERRFGGSK